MPDSTTEQQLATALPTILGHFQDESRQVFSPRDLRAVFSEHERVWGLVDVSFSRFLDTLLATRQLREAELRSREYTSLKRYVWGQVSPYELAQSIRPKAYFSHASAVFLHGLNDQIPNTLYLNQEQSPKPRASGGLTQGRVDFAFRRGQRKSRYVFEHGQNQIVLLSGKHTDRLGVEEMPFGTKRSIRVAGVERTLIDIVVRPDYSGGAIQILEAYRGARNLASVSVLRDMLATLDYVYPYHQSIGYLLEAADYESGDVQEFRKLPMELDFYLVPGMQDLDYIESWRLYVPQGFDPGKHS